MDPTNTDTAASAARQAAKAAIRVLGGPTKAAKRLGVPGHRPQTVQAWLRTRVPAEWCLLIEEATREAGQPHLCEAMRPDVAWRVVRGNSLI